MLEELKGKFIAKLVEQYGAWEKKVSRFGNATFGKVATDLCISASQFSKLISGNATEGMYIRSIRNIERLINEVWVDTEQTPLTPRFFNKENKQFTAEFNELQFENDPAFKKVATINSFFIDKFEIYRDSIVRRGEPCGRFADDIDQDLADEYEIDLKYILENVISDLTQTDCQAAPNKFCDPNDLQEGESVIDFACLYTSGSENLGIGGGYPYRKGYRLVKQNYSDNLTCNCE